MHYYFYFPSRYSFLFKTDVDNWYMKIMVKITLPTKLASSDGHSSTVLQNVEPWTADIFFYFCNIFVLHVYSILAMSFVKALMIIKVFYIHFFGSFSGYVFLVFLVLIPQKRWIYPKSMYITHMMHLFFFYLFYPKKRWILSNVPVF